MHETALKKRLAGNLRPLLPYFALLFFIGLFFFQSCSRQKYKQGEALYRVHCANCHMPDGTGLVGNIPPLAGSDYLKKDPARVACIIRNGLTDTIEVNGRNYNQPMLAIPQLSEFEIVNIINYINHSWGNDFGYLSLGKARNRLDSCSR